MDFFVDTAGAQETNNAEKKKLQKNIPDKKLGLKIPFSFDEEPNTEPITIKQDKKSDLDQCLDEFYANMGWQRSALTMIEQSALTKPKFTVSTEKIDVDAVMEKTVLKPGFDQQKHLPEYDPSDKKLKKERRLERSKTKGKNWFNLPATEMTEEVKKDLEVLQMRSALDPKHFYKKNDLAVLPKYFQIGKVVDSPLDFYGGRLTNKQRKSNLVEELLADAEFSKYNKKKYKEIMEQKSKTHFKRHKKDRKQKADKKK